MEELRLRLITKQEWLLINKIRSKMPVTVNFKEFKHRSLPYLIWNLKGVLRPFLFISIVCLIVLLVPWVAQELLGIEDLPYIRIARLLSSFLSRYIPPQLLGCLLTLGIISALLMEWLRTTWAQPRVHFWDEIKRLGIQPIWGGGDRQSFLKRLLEQGKLPLKLGPSGLWLDYYLERPEDKQIQDLLSKRYHVIIAGPPLAGKTRMAIEAIIKQAPPLVLIWPLQAIDSQPSDSYKDMKLPTKFAIILADDIRLLGPEGSFSPPQALKYLLNSIPELVLVATIRSYRPLIVRGLQKAHVILLEKMPKDRTEIQRLAEKVAEVEKRTIEEVLSRFNGQVGTLVVNPLTLLEPSLLGSYLEELEKKASIFQWIPTKKKQDVAIPILVRPEWERYRWVPWDEFRQQHLRIAVMGEPGSGKSFTAAITVLNLIKEAQQCIEKGYIDKMPVPIFVEDVSDLNFSQDPFETLQKYLQGQFRNHPGDFLEMMLKLSQKQAWLILDNVTDIKNLRAFWACLDQLFQGHVILFIRGKMDDDKPVVLSNLIFCELVPISRGRSIQLIEKIARNPLEARNLRKALRRSPYLQELCHSPLNLMFFCLTNESTITAIYLKVIRELIERNLEGQNALALINLWASLAIDLFTSFNFSLNRFLLPEVRKVLSQKMGLAEYNPGVDEQISFMEKSGLVYSDGHFIYFVVPTIFAFLAGRGLAFKDFDAELINQGLRNRQWDPIFPFVAGSFRMLEKQSELGFLNQLIAEQLGDARIFKTREEVLALLNLLVECLWEGGTQIIDEKISRGLVNAIDSLQRWNPGGRQWEEINAWPQLRLALRLLGRDLAVKVALDLIQWAYHKSKPLIGWKLRQIREALTHREPLVRWATLWGLTALNLTSQYPVLYKDIIDFLQNREEVSGIRALAARALGHLGYKERIKVLLKFINDPDEIVAASAIRALGRIAVTSKNASLFSEILKQCYFPQPFILQAAIHTLSLTGAYSLWRNQSVKLLRQALAWLENEYPPVRSGAASLIGETARIYQRSFCKVEPQKREEIVEKLVSRLKDEAITVCRSAAWALGQLARCECMQDKLERYSSTFWEVFKDQKTDPKIRCSIVNVLSITPEENRRKLLESLQDPAVAEAILHKFMQFEEVDKSLRQEVNRHLQTMRATSASALSRPIFNQRDPNWALHLSIRLVEAGPSEALKAMLRAWRIILSGDQLVQLQRVKDWQSLWAKFCSSLKSLLNEEDDVELLRLGVELLACIVEQRELLPEEMQDWLKNKLAHWVNSPDPWVRKPSWKMMISLNLLPDADLLCQGLKDGFVCKEALMLLERLLQQGGDFPWIHQVDFANFVKAKEPAIQASMAGLLFTLVKKGYVDEDKGAEWLLELLDNPDQLVRASAARTAEKFIKWPGVTDKLLELLNDPSRIVQKTALISLQRVLTILNKNQVQQIAKAALRMLRSYDPEAQTIAWGVLEDLKIVKIAFTMFKMDFAQKIKLLGRKKHYILPILYDLVNTVEDWVNDERKVNKVFTTLYKLLKQSGLLSEGMLSSILYTLGVIFSFKEIPSPEKLEALVDITAEFLEHKDPRVARNALCLMGTLSHRVEIKQEIVQKVVDYILQNLQKDDVKAQVAALYTLQAGLYLQEALARGDFLRDKLLNILLNGADDSLKMALILLQKRAVWKIWDEQQLSQIIQRIWKFIEDNQFIPIVLYMLATDHVAEALEEEQRRKITQKASLWIFDPSQPQEVRTTALNLLRCNFYWQLLEEPYDFLSKLLNLIQNDTELPQVRITAMGNLSASSVIGSLNDQLSYQIFKVLIKLLQDKKPGVSRGAMFLLFQDPFQRFLSPTEIKEVKDKIDELLKSQVIEDKLVALQAIDYLAERKLWREEEVKVIAPKLWILSSQAHPKVRAKAWPTYAKVLMTYPSFQGRKEFPTLLNSLVKNVLEIFKERQVNREVIYGALEALLTVQEELSTAQRDLIVEAVRPLLDSPFEKIKTKAMTLLNLISA